MSTMMKKTNAELAALYTASVVEGESVVDVHAFIDMVDAVDIADESLRRLVIAIRLLIAEIDSKLVLPVPEPTEPEVYATYGTLTRDDPGHYASTNERHAFVESELGVNECDRCGLPFGHLIHGHQNS